MFQVNNVAQNLYSVFDKKAVAYAPPFVAANHATAMRVVESAVRGGDSNLASYPQDFVLYCVGTMDMHLGVIHTSNEQPEQVCSVAELVSVAHNDAQGKLQFETGE